MNTTERFFAAFDASVDRRPGVPAERPPEPVGSAHWVEPEKQTPRGDLTMDPGRHELTATFGTGQPPRGLSGLLRRAAYRLPDYRANRWALLLLADRVDSMESRLVATATNPATWALAALGIGFAFAYRGRSPSRLQRIAALFR